MSKPVKEMMRKELIRRFSGIESLAVIGFVGLDAVATNLIRGRLKEKQIRLTVVKNSLARHAFKEIGLPQARDLLDGPCAVAYGGESVVDVVRELIDIGKEWPALTVKAALLDGEAFVGERVVALSNYPTRDEALATVVSCALSPGRNVAACLMAPGANIAGAVKTIEDRNTDKDKDQVEANE
ncbi:MAG: 50S ribosomal protein L10 [Planctomycetes bacterium]|nr:50S ribosomal protein L10 [Planctomycetota bacterium]